MDEIEHQLGKSLAEFSRAAGQEEWDKALRLGRGLVRVWRSLSVDALFMVAFNLAAACHSIYKTYPGGPRDTFGVAVRRSDRDLMFLLSSLYWSMAESIVQERFGDLKKPVRARAAVKEFRSLFMFKLGGLIGAPADRKRVFFETIDSIGEPEREFLEEQIDEAIDFVTKH